ncbi:MAG: redox-regulated ATPase YchF [Candidatus Micrarchaeia archaeon]|jgi:ribosome-binding ATPase YchF (GTP1/OBG family)
MLLGIIGAPNKGKSTIFSALTMVDVPIANYPFTTIKPNRGVAYVSKKCVDSELGVKCNPRNSICINGTRLIPVEIVDVAGLVPNAHLGKGMGNQFMNDLISADAFIQVVDLSGKTDESGNPCNSCDPAKEVKVVRDELAFWLRDIIKKHAGKLEKRSNGAQALAEILSGFKVSLNDIEEAAEKAYLSLTNINWSDDDMLSFSRELLKISKPTAVAANKLDISNKESLEKLKKELEGTLVVGCSGAAELTLRKAAKSGIIEYVPGASSFEVIGKPNEEQRRALEYLADFIKKNNGTGVQELINKVVFDLLKMIVAYPVEDENKYTDHYGNVLPDALLLKDGTTAIELAGIIHTSLAKNMLYAIDVKRKVRISKDYKIKDNDVIKIISASKN